jgi:hypothetical protein
MSDYKVKAKDSAGTEFVLGAAGKAIEAVALLNQIENRKLPVRDVVIEAPDGRQIGPGELKRLAMEEVHALALERAGKTHVPGRPPDD